MKGLYGIYIIVFSLFACLSNKKSLVKTLEFSKYNISAYGISNIDTSRGVENKIYLITLESGLKFNVIDGPQYREYFDYSFPIVDIKLKSRLGDSIAGVYFSSRPEEDSRLGVFNTNFYFLDTANQLERMVIHPKRIGKGVTGAWVFDDKGTADFCVYAKNLDSSDHSQLLRIINSISRRKDL